MNNFSAMAKSFILSLIRQRTYLNKHHLSHGDLAIFEAEINFLKLHLTVNGYNSDRHMAGFWIRHSTKISCLIPGGHASSTATHHKFLELLNEAYGIYNQVNSDQLIPKTHDDLNSTIGYR